MVLSAVAPGFTVTVGRFPAILVGDCLGFLGFLGDTLKNTSVSKDQYEREEAEKEMELSVALPA